MNRNAKIFFLSFPFKPIHPQKSKLGYPYSESNAKLLFHRDTLFNGNGQTGQKG